jgi:glyoxylase-like metal-dependent hydrolase (beta-lactamase superfamily II)/rhodanese-related sulfurtransferase
MEIDVIVTEGLGDNSFLIRADRHAVVVDPQRDVERVVAALEAHGVDLRFAVETHVHNDYVSGAPALRALTGAEIVGPADAGYAFAFLGMRDGDELAVGDGSLLAVATPGHTPEHTAYVVRDGDATPLAVLSGGSLTVGTAGRTDLLGDAVTPELTRSQFRSVRRLAELPDEVLLLPTHGAGSFCASAPSTPSRTSTIGRERASNGAMMAPDEATFVARQLDGLPAFPTYYERMAPINRVGPEGPRAPAIPRARTADEIAAELQRGAVLVDGRDGRAFAAEHVPDSLNVPLEDSFASYVGWLVPFDTTIALVMPDHDAVVEATTQLFRIGYERIVGVLDGGTGAWAASGRDVVSYETIGARELADELREGGRPDLLDVRQRIEWDDGHLERSHHVFVGELPAVLSSFDRARTVTVICASGYRSAMASSMLDAGGIRVRLVAPGGVPKVRSLLGR